MYANDDVMGKTLKKKKKLYQQLRQLVVSTRDISVKAKLQL